MLKKIALTTAAIAALATGAIALDAKPAEAGVTIQLGHGQWHGKAPQAKRFNGHRLGNYGRFRPFCVTKVRAKKVRFWSPRYHRWLTRTVKRPVTICR